MTDVINGEHHCIDPYLPLQDTEIQIDLPRKLKISNLHKTNLQQLHFEGRPGTHFECKQESATSDN